MDKISVIVPVHNVIDYIDMCLNSIILQSYKNIEILVIDDGSTDGSSNRCDFYAQKDNRIKCFHTEAEGVSNARNIGIEAASGEYVVFVDADDWIDEEFIDALHTGIIKSQADIYMTGYFEEYVNGNKEVNFMKEEKLEFLDDNGIKKELIDFCLVDSPVGNSNSVVNIGVPWAKIYKKELLDIHQIRFVYGLKRMEDSIFNLYAFYYSTKLVYENISGYHYRRRILSACQSYSPDFEITADRILEQIKVFYFEKYENCNWEKVYYKKAFLNFLECVRLQYVSKNCSLNLHQKITEIKRLSRLVPYNGIKDFVNYEKLSLPKKIALLFYKMKYYRGVYILLVINRKLKKARLR